MNLIPFKCLFSSALRLLLVPLALAVLVPQALAAPRIGSHDGYTRLVFNLPKVATSTVKVSGQSVTVRLNVSLPAEQGALNAAGVTAYAVAGGTVTVTLAKGHASAKASVLPAASGQPARLVIDVPTSAAAARVPATPQARTTSPAPRSTPIRTTPAAVTRPAGSGTSIRPRVVLDAGHGGIDPGMVSRWVTEKEVTLAIALRVRAELVKHGIDVVMVRETDRHLSSDKRTDLESRSRLATTGAVSAFVSIHVNAASSSAQGIETYYFGQPLAGSDRSQAVRENGGGSVGQELTRQAANSAQSLLGDILAQAKVAFSRQLAQKVQANLIAATGAVNRGVHTDTFYVIRNPTTAAILTEIGFGSSPVEGPRLANPAYRDRIAQAIARAILDFLNTK
ncbi:N-acetylmuramoyl-L-alanine amidase [Deinococcus sp. QL22]|uniref:N-acetylmuramoyl-L-alanine amidase family protein n=1 Tax=Deinococcus sp. QL22 TaxID=2939437 RepID=UPI002017D5FC|nr:N-acetylmuramoyl-L-alanine amidase [Deinococcus sp. QL22]UQN06110.1 N-acetylmuramoyl-L-alanine amidase [Deinococcus sp. QL22]